MQFKQVGGAMNTEGKGKLSEIMGCDYADETMKLYPEIFAYEPLSKALLLNHVKRCDRCQEMYGNELEAYQEAENAGNTDDRTA
jgi:hypothetical protein